MSARVFNPTVPAIMSDLNKHAKTSSTDINISAFSMTLLSPIKRNLFGTCSTEDHAAFADQHMDESIANSSKYWEFDFIEEYPQPNRGRFDWKACPEKLNLSRPMKRDRESSPDNSIHYYIPLSDDSSSLDSLDSSLEKDIQPQNVQINKKQAKITDFLKVKKESSSQQKKLQEIKKSIMTPSPRIGRISKARRLKI